MQLALLVLSQNNLCFHPELEELRKIKKTSLIEFDNFSDDTLVSLVKNALQENPKIDSLFIFSEEKELPLGKIIALVSFLVSSKIKVGEIKFIGEHVLLQKMLQNL